MGGSIRQRGDRFAIIIYWQGKHYYFNKTIKGDPIMHPALANQLLSKIQSDITEETFNPKYYRPNSPLALGEYFNNWIKLNRGCKATKQRYTSYFYCHTFPFFTEKFDIRNFTHARLCAFYNHLNETVSRRTAFNIMAILRAMLNFAFKNEDIRRMPMFPELSQGEQGPIDYLTVDQQEKLLEAIPERHRPLFEMMMEYGLRQGEVRGLQWDAIDDKNIMIRSAISGSILQGTKTGRVRVYAITERARIILSKARSNNPFSKWVFSSNRKNKPYSQKFINQVWREACRISDIKIHLKNATRHSLACQLLDMGYDYGLVGDALGHSKIETTRKHYAKRNPIQIKDALEARAKVIKIGLVTDSHDF